LIPTLIEALKNSKIPEIRTPKNANDFIFVEDMARGLIACALKGEAGGVYNLASGKETTPPCEPFAYLRLKTLPAL
jgi:nucleoside-diphosphate-sugar epimerase